MTVVETKTNGFGQIVIDFKYYDKGLTYGMLVVNKNFPFNPRCVERPKRKK